MPTILVTDGQTRAALAAVRALGRAHHRVLVAGDRLQSVAAASRYAALAVHVPDPTDDATAFANRLEHIVAEEGVDLVLPVAEASTRALLRHTKIGCAKVAAARPEAFGTLSNKVELLTLAAEVGLPVPRSIVVDSASDVERAAADMGFPCVLKPHRSVVSVGGARSESFGPRRVARCEDLVPAYPAAAFPVIVQQWVPGSGEGLFFLMDRGRPIAIFAHRRLREKPPGGGVSVYREAVAVPADAADGAERLLAAVRWHGVAMVEFRRTPPTDDEPMGIPYLMEVNGRFWGSLQLAIDAGVDFPNLLVDMVLGRTMARRPGPYRVGVRSRWFWGDVDHVLARLRRSREWLGLSATAPSRLLAIGDFLRVRRRDRWEVFDWRDPQPFVRETLGWFHGEST